ncbi:MAG: dTDP-4-dehydrorhamnose 3,5-epimerase [Gammaproteobacteria bacterium]
MKVTTTKLAGVLIIEPKVFGDTRGFFKEAFQVDRYREIGVDVPFVQENHSRSHQGVLRGLHLQKNRPQGKLVSCSFGSIFDVVVDVDPNSITFSQHFSIELSDENHLQLWIPPGYAHGFCVTSEIADFQYKCTDYYFPEDEFGVVWSDSDLAIDWPILDPLVSDKDLALPRLNQGLVTGEL